MNKQVEEQVERTQRVICDYCISDECPEGYARYLPCIECRNQAKQVLFNNNLAIIDKNASFALPGIADNEKAGMDIVSQLIAQGWRRVTLLKEME